VEDFRAAAIAKYGPQLQRPQDKYDGLLKRRKEINRKDFSLYSHPLGDEIRTWFLPRKWLNPVELPETAEVKFVYRLDQIVKLTSIINTEGVFSVTFKESCEISYFDMICILIIYVGKVSYVIDTFSLFNSVKPILGNIFADPKILKICYSGTVIPKLQRDFDVFTAGAVVLQEVIGATPCQKVSTMHELFFDLFEVQYDYLTVFAAWDSRPLHRQLISRAGLEAFLLLKAWNFCVEKLGDELVMLNFEETVKANLQLFQPEEFNDPEEAYQVILCNIEEDLISTFVQRRLMFVELFEWRHSVGKDFDFDLYTFLPLSFLSKIVCKAPKNITDLLSVFPDASSWDSSIQDSLFLICSKIESSEPVEYSNIPVFLSNRDDSYSDEINKDCIRTQNLIVVSPQENTFLSKSKQRKERVKEINRQRAQFGEAPLQIKRNRGKKDRERSKKRAFDFFYKRGFSS